MNFEHANLKVGSEGIKFGPGKYGEFPLLQLKNKK